MRVAVIGAGVAGSFLAYLLASGQIRTVIFEKTGAGKALRWRLHPEADRDAPVFEKRPRPQ